MRELPAGRDAVLLDLSGEPDPAVATLKAYSVLRQAMSAGLLPGVFDVIAAAETVLVQAEPGAGLDELSVRRALRRVDFTEDSTRSAEDVEPIMIPVYYNGIDLGDAAERCSLSVADVIAAHTQAMWRVQFMGSAPGFGYLVPQQDSIVRQLTTLPRRDESGPPAPAGSVAVAAGYGALCPRESRGGWWVLGGTEIALWDNNSERPALLNPGALVRFTDAGGP